MKDIICFSGGEGSALTAVEVARKKGTKNMILLNHNINSKKEDDDIKRFKQDVADYLHLPITYANISGISDPDKIPNQFDVCIAAGAFTSPNGNALCTSLLKTIPFINWLENNYPIQPSIFGPPPEAVIIHYGFDKSEFTRINRRIGIMAAMGYKTDYPLALWKDRTIQSINEINITPPTCYNYYEHANCKGCLKASLLHWYVTYVHEPETYAEGIFAENEIGFTIHTIKRNKEKRSISLVELAVIFEQMRLDGIPATEHQNKFIFANLIRKYQLEECNSGKPCECIA